MTEHSIDAYAHGDMDIQAHQASFHAFILMAKWGSLCVATGLLFFVIWFCTAAGIGAAFIAAVVLALVGTAILREKRPVAH
jgi:hypothetical protein